MKILLVFAHPEPRSLNGALRDVAIKELEAQGHEVRLTDLYAEGWKSEVDRADFRSLDADAPLKVAAASGEAFAAGTLTEDVKAEQSKLRWADVLILQFPLWWFTMPAILKGWVDRVYAFGFAYGVGEQNEERWGDRYGEGTLAGKRAMLLVTTGGWKEHYSARGINGPIDDLLFPINHGILYYPGYDDPQHATAPRTRRTGSNRLRAPCKRRHRCGRLAPVMHLGSAVYRRLKLNHPALQRWIGKPGTLGVWSRRVMVQVSSVSGSMYYGKSTSWQRAAEAQPT